MLNFKTGGAFGSTCPLIKNLFHRTFTKDSVTLQLSYVDINERQKSEDAVKSAGLENMLS
jgi:hypothetical protein